MANIKIGDTEYEDIAGIMAQEAGNLGTYATFGENGTVVRISGNVKTDIDLTDNIRVPNYSLGASTDVEITNQGTIKFISLACTGQRVDNSEISSTASIELPIVASNDIKPVVNSETKKLEFQFTDKRKYLHYISIVGTDSAGIAGSVCFPLLTESADKLNKDTLAKAFPYGTSPHACSGMHVATDGIIYYAISVTNNSTTSFVPSMLAYASSAGMNGYYIENIVHCVDTVIPL